MGRSAAELGCFEIPLQAPIHFYKAPLPGDETGKEYTHFNLTASSTSLDRQGEVIEESALKNMAALREVRLQDGHHVGVLGIFGYGLQGEIVPVEKGKKLEYTAYFTDDSTGNKAEAEIRRHPDRFGWSVGGRITHAERGVHPETGKPTRFIKGVELRHIALTDNPAQLDTMGSTRFENDSKVADWQADLWKAADELLPEEKPAADPPPPAPSEERVDKGEFQGRSVKEIEAAIEAMLDEDTWVVQVYPDSNSVITRYSNYTVAVGYMDMFYVRSFTVDEGGSVTLGDATRVRQVYLKPSGRIVKDADWTDYFEAVDAKGKENSLEPLGAKQETSKDSDDTEEVTLMSRIRETVAAGIDWLTKSETATVKPDTTETETPSAEEALEALKATHETAGAREVADQVGNVMAAVLKDNGETQKAILELVKSQTAASTNPPAAPPASPAPPPGAVPEPPATDTTSGETAKAGEPAAPETPPVAELAADERERLTREAFNAGVQAEAAKNASRVDTAEKERDDKATLLAKLIAEHAGQPQGDQEAIGTGSVGREDTKWADGYTPSGVFGSPEEARASTGPQ